MQEYRASSFVVRYDENICAHAANCVSQLPAVFDVTRKPWVNVEGAEASRIEAQVKACPSGALSFVPVGRADTP
jgi:putative redox protein